MYGSVFLVCAVLIVFVVFEWFKEINDKFVGVMDCYVVMLMVVVICMSDNVLCLF